MDKSGSTAGPVPRHLPGHIAALAGAEVERQTRPASPGRAAAWPGKTGEDHNFEDDDGAADAGYLAAVAALRSGSGDERQSSASLATARVFIPIIAQLAEESEGAGGLVADNRRTWRW